MIEDQITILKEKRGKLINRLSQEITSEEKKFLDEKLLLIDNQITFLEEVERNGILDEKTALKLMEESSGLLATKEGLEEAIKLIRREEEQEFENRKGNCLWWRVAAISFFIGAIVEESIWWGIGGFIILAIAEYSSRELREIAKKLNKIVPWWCAF